MRVAEKNKNIIHQPRSVRIGKNCALCLVYGPRPTARVVRKTSGIVLLIPTSRLVNNIYSITGMPKGTFPDKMAVYKKKGKGLDLGAEPPRTELPLSTPPLKGVGGGVETFLKS